MFTSLNDLRKGWEMTMRRGKKNNENWLNLWKNHFLILNAPLSECNVSNEVMMSSWERECREEMKTERKETQTVRRTHCNEIRWCILIDVYIRLSRHISSDGVDANKIDDDSYNLFPFRKIYGTIGRLLANRQQKLASEKIVRDCVGKNETLICAPIWTFEC